MLSSPRGSDTTRPILPYNTVADTIQGQGGAQAAGGGASGGSGGGGGQADATQRGDLRAPEGARRKEGEAEVGGGT
eukprot:9080398-Pyramimonas_sp.AAC.1